MTIRTQTGATAGRSTRRIPAAGTPRPVRGRTIHFHFADRCKVQHPARPFCNTIIVQPLCTQLCIPTGCLALGMIFTSLSHH